MQPKQTKWKLSFLWHLRGFAVKALPQTYRYARPLTHITICTLSSPPEKAPLTPRHPFAQIHDRKQDFWHQKKEKRKEKKKEQTNPEQEDKVMVVEEEWERPRQKRKRKSKCWHIYRVLWLCLFGVLGWVVQMWHHSQEHLTGGWEKWVTGAGAASVCQFKGKWQVM